MTGKETMPSEPVLPPSFRIKLDANPTSSYHDWQHYPLDLYDGHKEIKAYILTT